MIFKNIPINKYFLLVILNLILVKNILQGNFYNNLLNHHLNQD